ncbi:hypothetical protein [Desemzia incerta]|uniref:hypothetical protein n=1 Tax=Desemzia incerta TaxID=82801 RepID=UPI001661345E|nr:hypothetical protein [Desemzia incerta]
MTEDIRQRIENSNRLTEQLERTGDRLDIGAIYEGAQREGEARAERQRKLREQQAAAQAAEDKELTDLLKATAEHSSKEAEAKAALEIKEAQAKAEKELAAKIRKQNGLKSDEEEVLDNSYRSMLGNFNL